VELDGPQLLTLLRANRESLVRQNQVEKGNTLEQAESEIGFLLTALDCLAEARLSLASAGGAPEARLELRLRVPDAKRVARNR
jgi:hypothetical protein